MSTAELFLRKNEDRRLRAGHLWVYANEVDTVRSPLKSFTPGQPVLIKTAQGNTLGSGYANPHSLICARLVSRNSALPFAEGRVAELLQKRLRVALDSRKQLFSSPYYRMVYGESDALPGLVVDRFGDHLVGQITSMGMQLHQDEIARQLITVTGAKTLLWRNDVPLRELEGLPLVVENGVGETPTELVVEEHGAQFVFDPWQGQKTGWYYDQTENRRDLGRWVRGKRVLDVCSYLGGWAVQAARAGASEVLAVDSSAKALELLQANANRNKVKVTGLEGDAFETLKALVDNGERFDALLVDPPPFIKRKKDQKAGAEAYQRLNKLAIRLLNPGGVLISSSCSQHFSAGDLLQAIRRAGQQERRHLQLLSRGGQGPDHPVHPAMVETDYLHSYFLRVQD